MTTQTAMYSQHGLAYWKLGKQGTPIVLIMGIGMSGMAWELQSNELSKNHQVMFFDHLGLGLSAPLKNQKITMQRMTEHVLQIMDELSWNNAHIVGISMGGMIAQHLALLAPQRVRTLNLIATTAGGLSAFIPTWKGLSAFAKVTFASNGHQRLQALQQLLFPDGYQFNQISLTHLLEVYGVQAAQKTLLKQLIAILKHDTRDKLQKLSGIFTQIHCPDQDVVIAPGQNLILNQLIPNSTLIHYTESGHGVIYQDAQKVNQNLENTFSSYDNEN
ncbi:MAG: hypothetical protein COW84_09045 [Gammaproteobacteria bacterium CG22_combo_CG10-13_8_21_14_all_40_8]|nr:MAG: hypothetical protein COW84_09045 [Gammaproteobacteria bacterium CG22_combo_CG10-13_8_21_14_all_40_8]